MKPVVLVLAGGQSTRLWPLSDKNLIPVMGKPLIRHQLEGLAKFGFQDIIVVGNQPVVDFLAGSGLASKAGPCYTHIIKQSSQLTGMAGAILSAQKIYESKYKERSLYIVIANDFFESKLQSDMLSAWQTNKGDAYIAAYQVKAYRPQGYLLLEGDRIKNIVEKPDPDKMPSKWANLGLYIYRQPPLLFAELKKEQAKDVKTDDVYERAMSNLMPTQNFQKVEYPRESVILKYPWHLLDVMELFLENIKQTNIDKTVQVSPKATIKGNVMIEKGVKILEGAVVSGPAYIGPNTIIANNALVRSSAIGADCEIGFGTEIARSYVGDKCRLHTNYIGDSVLEGNNDFGAGAVTANFRFDEGNIFSVVKGEKIDTQRTKLGAIIGRGAKVGVNASLMPGVKINALLVIKPGSIQNQDLKS